MLTLGGLLALAVGGAEARISAVQDSFVTFRGQQIVIRFGDLLENDICTNRNPKPFCLTPLSVTKVIKGNAKGSLVVEGGKIRFILKPGFTGTTSFKYVIAGKNGQPKDTGVIKIRVRPSPGG